MFIAYEKLVAQTDVMTLIADIADCVTENDVLNLSKEIIEALEADSFVYATILPPGFIGSIDSHLYLIGCQPELCSIYNKRMWMMNDPCIDYARSNSAPIVGSKLKVLTSGQREIMHTAAQYGFRSGLVIPTHTSMDANKCMGMLYVGSDLPQKIGEPKLLNKRVYFGTLGMELLLWWNNRLKYKAMRKYSLLNHEVELLQLSKKGLVAIEIAAILDIKIGGVYKKLNLIKEKFNVDKIEQALTIAEAVGLIR